MVEQVAPVVTVRLGVHFCAWFPFPTRVYVCVTVFGLDSPDPGAGGDPSPKFHSQLAAGRLDVPVKTTVTDPEPVVGVPDRVTVGAVQAGGVVTGMLSVVLTCVAFAEVTVTILLTLPPALISPSVTVCDAVHVIEAPGARLVTPPQLTPALLTLLSLTTMPVTVAVPVLVTR